MITMLWGIILLLSFICFGSSVLVMWKNFDSPMAQKACVALFALGILLLFINYFVALGLVGKL